jgi:hypothetical protein
LAEEEDTDDEEWGWLKDAWNKHVKPHVDKAVNHVKEHVGKAVSGKAALAESTDADVEEWDWLKKAWDKHVKPHVDKAPPGGPSAQSRLGARQASVELLRSTKVSFSSLAVCGAGAAVASQPKSEACRVDPLPRGRTSGVRQLSGPRACHSDLAVVLCDFLVGGVLWRHPPGANRGAALGGNCPGRAPPKGLAAEAEDAVRHSRPQARTRHLDPGMGPRE